MVSNIKSDRKQVFGSEELDESYLAHISDLFDDRIRKATLKAAEDTAC